VTVLARKFTLPAIHTLVLCLKSNNERARVAAAAVLLDRGWGKPPQSIESEVTVHTIIDHSETVEGFLARVGALPAPVTDAEVVSVDISTPEPSQDGTAPASETSEATAEPDPAK
jgi:hypothetical protein